MVSEKLNNQELEFMEAWHTPRQLLECLFHNFDNLSQFHETKLGDLRLYQIPMIGNSPIIDFEGTAKHHKLSKKQAFILKKNVDDSYNFGGRKYGKTLCCEKLDVPRSMLHDDEYSCGFTSLDLIHLRGVLDFIAKAIKHHPILKAWLQGSIRVSPNYNISAKNGWQLTGVNMNLKARKDPGEQFFQKHFHVLWSEEASFEVEEVYNKRKESTSEFGVIERFAGMTNFSKYMPAGKKFYDLKNRMKVINLPQFVNPFWDETEKKDRIEHYGGKDTTDYRIFVEGEVVEDGIAEFDMDRIRENYLDKVEIKRFEIPKSRYNKFRETIVVERPKNAEQVIVCADIGDGAGGTEIIILSEIKGIYTYLYNISLYNLKHEEQLEIFKYIIDGVQTNIIGVECGEALGRTLADDFEKIYGMEHVIRYAGREKVKVGFVTDEKTKKVIFQNGKPIYKEEYMSEWSVRRLKNLLYNKKFRMPLDYRFDKQLNSVISKLSGTRKTYICPSGIGDHLFDAFKVLAIIIWIYKDFDDVPPASSSWGLGTNF